jgi:hypothetical protein
MSVGDKLLADSGQGSEKIHNGEKFKALDGISVDVTKGTSWSSSALPAACKARFCEA